MATKNKLVRDNFIAKIRPFKRIEPVPKMSSVYTTFNEVLIDVRFSALMEKGHYWFFLDTHRLNQWRGKQRFVECLICGDEGTVIFIPDDKVFQWYDGIEPNRKGHWFALVRPEGDKLILRIGHGRSDIDAQEYLNRFDFISPLIPTAPPRPATTFKTTPSRFEEIKAIVLADGQLQGDSLHERVVDMITQIGEWSGFDARKSYTTEPKSPYIIDAVWLQSGEIDTAIEVHDGGNETEAKDRLRQALRFGARKVIIVSVPGAIARLKSLCRFESDLKNWLEIWSVARVYEMYRNGRQFFEDFRPFRKRQRSDDVVEYL